MPEDAPGLLLSRAVPALMRALVCVIGPRNRGICGRLNRKAFLNNQGAEGGLPHGEGAALRHGLQQLQPSTERISPRRTISVRRNAERKQRPSQRPRRRHCLRLHSRRERQRPSPLPRRRGPRRATQYSLMPSHPSTRVSLQARPECKLAWTSTAPTKQAVATVV
jgi:hypothetical protein